MLTFIGSTYVGGNQDTETAGGAQSTSNANTALSSNPPTFNDATAVAFSVDGGTTQTNISSSSSSSSQTTNNTPVIVGTVVGVIGGITVITIIVYMSQLAYAKFTAGQVASSTAGVTSTTETVTLGEAPTNGSAPTISQAQQDQLTNQAINKFNVDPQGNQISSPGSVTVTMQSQGGQSATGTTMPPVELITFS